MKQFLRFSPTPELGLKEIHQSLSTRFPVYKTSIRKNKVTIRKNALATACIKVEHSDDETCISIDTKMFFWVWLIVGWVFYLIGTKGFVDEIFSTLERDLKNKYPSKFDCTPNAYQRAEWKTKTQSLGILGWGLFAYTCMFSCFSALITPVFINMIIDNLTSMESSLVVYQIYGCHHFIKDILWILIGLILFKCSTFNNTKISGVLFVVHGLLMLIINVSNTFHLHSEMIITNIYFAVFLYNVFLFLAGYFFNRNLKYGISRYVNIAILILVVTSICHNVFLYSIMNYQDLLEQGYYEKANLMNIMISICTWPFIYTAYFMIARAFSKIPNYPLYKISNK